MRHERFARSLGIEIGVEHADRARELQFARGAFTDVLDALTVLFHEQVELAVADGNADKATASAKAVRLVEEAKRAAEGNAIPQLVTAQLLRGLAEAGV